MAARVIESEARITARDGTGNVFPEIAAKVNKLGAAMKNAGGSSASMIGGMTQGMAKLDSVIGKVAKSLLAANIAHKMTSIVEGVSKTFAHFDDLVRYQRAISGMTAEQQKPFIDQAIRGGANSKFNDIQWIEAQNSLIGRGINRDFARPIVEAAANYGQAMNVDLPEAATAIEGALFSTGKHLETFADAVQAASHAADFMVKLAKIGGLSNEDVTQAFKYSGLSGSTAGLSDETMGAMWALMHRSNIGGAEAGVAVRALAGRLVSPTKQGIEALAASGIDYNKFVHGATLSSSSFANFMALRFGQHLGAGMAGKVGQLFADPEVTGNAGEFTTKVFDAVKGVFPAGKKGGMKAKDSAELTKSIRDYYKMVAGGVDSEGLLRAMMGAGMTLGQYNAFVGQKQGGRVIAFMRDLALFEEYYKKLKEAPEGFAKSIADERMAGYSGAQARAEGSYKNVETAIGRAWENEATSALNTIAHLEQSFAELDRESIRVVTGFATVTASLVSIGTVLKTLEAFGVTIAGTLATLISRLSVLGMPLALSGDTMQGADQSWQKKNALPPGWDYTFKSTGGFSFSPGSTDGGHFGYKSSTWLPSWLSGGDPVSNVTPTSVRPATEAEITGQIDVKSQVNISLDTNMFRAQVLSTVKSEISNLRSRGDMSTGTSGPVGPSMPEVGPQQQ